MEGSILMNFKGIMLINFSYPFRRFPGGMSLLTPVPFYLDVLTPVPLWSIVVTPVLYGVMCMGECIIFWSTLLCVIVGECLKRSFCKRILTFVLLFWLKELLSAFHCNIIS